MTSTHRRRHETPNVPDSSDRAARAPDRNRNSRIGFDAAGLARNGHDRTGGFRRQDRRDAWWRRTDARVTRALLPACARRRSGMRAWGSKAVASKERGRSRANSPGPGGRGPSESKAAPFPPFPPFPPEPAEAGTTNRTVVPVAAPQTGLPTRRHWCLLFALACPQSPARS